MKSTTHLIPFIRDIPDFPKPGILFRDVSPLLASPEAFGDTIEAMAHEWREGVDMIAGLDARGFIFGTALAIRLQLPLLMIRKKGKLPGKTAAMKYGLEYGQDVIEISTDTVPPGKNVLIVDDLLATGGTAHAACKLVESLGLNVAGCAFVIEVAGLPGRSTLGNHKVTCVLTY